MKGQRLSIFHATTLALRRIGAALLPQDCLLCGAAAGAEILCQACVDNLPRLPGNLCPVCALPSPAEASCGKCLGETPHFDATLAGFRYGFPVDRLIQALKYQHRLALAPWFARALLASPPPEGDLMLALPLAERRLGERGFNQALEIARPLAQALSLALPLETCVRAHDGAPQASLPWKERQKNVRGVFECRKDLTGKSVIVVDDVMTTGATLNEFARTLKKHGAARVTNWVVARTLMQ